MTDISNQVQAWLAAGNRITEVPGYMPQPRRPHYVSTAEKSAAKQEPKRENIPPWANCEEVLSRMLRERVTRKALANESGLNVGTLNCYLDGTFNPRPMVAKRVEMALDRLIKARIRRNH